MFLLMLVTLTILPQKSFVSGLDCYAGPSAYGLVYTKCDPSTYHCAKFTTINPG